MVRRFFMFASIAIAAVMVSSTSFVSAQGNGQVNNGNGLRISPVRNELTIKPGASQVIDVYLQNITNSPAQIKGVVNDFVASDDESGQPRPLLDDGDTAPTNSLKNYVDKISDFSLQPQEQKIIKVRVSIPANAAGGGYFGVVRFLPATSDSSKNVSLSASVGSLILVTVPGDIKEQASVASFNVARYDGESMGKASNFFTTGGKDSDGRALQSIVRIKNSGNIQVAPFGKMQLKKSGKVLATYEINDVQPRGNVLPNSVRRFTIDLGDKTSSFGRYTLEGNFGYGTNGQLISTKTSFMVVPLPFILMSVGLLLVLVAALLVLPRMLKAHDRKLLRKVRGRRK